MFLRGLILAVDEATPAPWGPKQLAALLTKRRNMEISAPALQTFIYRDAFLSGCVFPAFDASSKDTVNETILIQPNRAGINR